MKSRFALAALVIFAAAAILASHPSAQAAGGDVKAPPSSNRDGNEGAASAMATLNGLITGNLPEDAQERVHITRYWNLAIWQGVGSRYPNDWNRNIGTIMQTDDPRTAFLYLARESAERSEIIRAVSTAGVPDELVALGGRVAGVYENIALATLARLDQGAPRVDLDERAAEALQEDIETLRRTLNDEHGLNLVEVSIAGRPGG